MKERQVKEKIQQKYFTGTNIYLSMAQIETVYTLYIQLTRKSKYSVSLNDCLAVWKQFNCLKEILKKQNKSMHLVKFS